MTAELVAAAIAVATAVVLVGARGAVSLARTRPVQAAAAHVRRPRVGRLRRGDDLRTDDVAGWCEQIARALRSGSSLSSAVLDAADSDGAVGAAVAPVGRQLGRGRSLVDALDDVLATTSAASDLGLALTVLRSCARFGGPAATPLERAAATLRAREAIVAEQMAHSAQARLSARVLTLVPIGLLALLAGADPKVRAAVATPGGLSAVVLGTLLNLTGAWWMRRIIGRPA